MTLLLEHFDTLLATPADVDHLNRAILTLAVQGRLVPQDPQDEPASELLKRLQKTTNRKIQPISSADEPYKLPKSWIWAKTGELYEIIGGGTPSTKNPEFWDGDIPWITSADILNPKEIRIRKTITKAALEHSTTNLVPAESIIVVTRVGLGKVGLTNVPLCFSQDSHALIANSKFIYPDYALYCLLVAAQSFRENSRGTTIFGITRSQLENVPFPLPPYQEQIRIIQKIELMLAQTRALADKLSRAESDLAALNQSALAHLLAADGDFEKRWDFLAAHFGTLFTRPEHVAPLRQSILELAVRGKLTRREAGDESARELLGRIRQEKVERGKKEVFAPIKESEKPFPLPDGWEWARLKQITLDLQTGPFGSNLHKSDYVANGIPVVNPVNMRDGKIAALGDMMISEKTRERLSQYILETGDLVLARRGEIGRCALVTEKESGWLCGTGSLRMKLSENVSKDFIVLLLKTDFARSRLTKETVGITMSNMSQTALENLAFALPPLAEQARIVAKVESLLGLCAALESRLRAAQEERSRLVVSVLAGAG